MLRENVSLVLSDELDDQLINGTGANDDLVGIFERLTNPSAPAANVETWTRFLAIQSGGIDGLWATELEHIAMVVGVDTYRLSAATFQGTDSEDRGQLPEANGRRLLDEFPHAGDRGQRSAGDLVPQGAAGDADGHIADMGLDLHR